jgi:hypothetical protein
LVILAAGRSHYGLHSTPSIDSTMRSAIETSAGLAPAAPPVEFSRDVAPRPLVPPISRHVPHQLPHVGERLERHDFGDDDEPG